jgi:hypothetical protein
MSLMYASLNPRLTMANIEEIAKRSTDAKIKCIETCAKAIEETPAEYRDQVIITMIPILLQTLCWL